LNGYLLDTHALIWWFMNSPRLGKLAKAGLEASEAPVFVSAATAFGTPRSTGSASCPT
jgi:PIN domain nuclease of toxin-antitoxin system